jgi:hypothetical protein
MWEQRAGTKEAEGLLLSELQRAIIYTTRMSKQVTKSHVRNAVIVYRVNDGARLTQGYRSHR